MKRNQQPDGNGLTSLTAGMISNLGNINDWRPRRIGIAGVRFNSGGDAGFSVFVDGKPADKKAEPTAEEKAAAEEAAKKATDKAAADAAKVPEKYELSVPDEAKQAIGDKHVERITAAVEEFAQANKLTAEQAQAELEARLDGAHTTVAALRDEWLNETKADPTWGGEKLEETQRLSRKAVDGIFPEGHALRAAFINDLNQTGIGNKLTVVAFLATLGKLMGEDAPAMGKLLGKETPKKSDAEVMFPSSAPKS